MKNSKQTPALFIVLLSLLFLTGCFEEKKTATTFKIKPPIAGHDIAFTSFTIDPTINQTITLENGGSIVIPANSFCNLKGEKITTPVTIGYREFKKTSEIITSGIPMTYKQGDEEIPFESAGMFELTGSTSGNTEVLIASDKTVQVNMVSPKADNDFNFYYYDKEKNEWIEKIKAVELPDPVVCSIDSAAVLASLSMEKPEDPSCQTNKFTFSLEIDKTQYPQLASYNSIMWQYAGTDPSKDPENNKWIFDKSSGHAIELVKKEGSPINYNLTATITTANGKQKTFKTEIRPVLFGKDMKAAEATFNKQMKTYNAEIVKRIAAASQQQVQGNVMRRLTVSKFGIFNCDRFYNRPNVIQTNANFTFKGFEKMGGDPVLYLICGEQKAVVNYYMNEGKCSFTFQPNEKNTLIAILPGNQLFVFSNERFKELRKSELSGNDFTFKMTDTYKNVNNTEELDNFIGSL
ncbi:MAG: hypothetical protein H7321_07495 [Bacteroidia bacterium]|nr:hypothetical protein [Bacteroidia bacterium]